MGDELPQALKQLDSIPPLPRNSVWLVHESALRKTICATVADTLAFTEQDKQVYQGVKALPAQTPAMRIL